MKLIKPILLIGSSGQVGAHFLGLMKDYGEITAPDSKTLNLADGDSIESAIRSIKPKLIINCGAYTHVDLAESETSLAFAINAQAPRILAKEARKLGAGLIHFSTDYVYDGNKNQAYVETDPIHPLSVYGKSKAEGDAAIVASGVPYWIFRTSWVYAERGRNFLMTILRLAGERKELKIVNDQTGAPTWSRCIAKGTLDVLHRIMGPHGDQPMEALNDSFGIYHMTCGGSATWYEFAREILNLTGISPAPKIVPIPTADFPTPAARPLNSVLNNSKLHQTFSVQLPPWRTALEECVSLLNFQTRLNSI